MRLEIILETAIIEMYQIQRIGLIIRGKGKLKIKDGMQRIFGTDSEQ